MPDSYFGYQVRSPYQSENAYFRKNPTVSGMATKDSKIIFNPYAKGVNFNAVGINEGARLWMRENKVNPTFPLTDEQVKLFKDTPYAKDESAMRHTILARIISGDPSVGEISPAQRRWAEWLSSKLKDKGGMP